MHTNKAERQRKLPKIPKAAFFLLFSILKLSTFGDRCVMISAKMKPNFTRHYTEYPKLSFLVLAAVVSKTNSLFCTVLTRIRLSRKLPSPF